MKSEHIVIIGCAAAAAFILLRGKSGPALANMPNGKIIRSASGQQYITAPRPASSFDIVSSGAVINLANSNQVIRPASSIDLLMGTP